MQKIKVSNVTQEFLDSLGIHHQNIDEFKKAKIASYGNVTRQFYAIFNDKFEVLLSGITTTTLPLINAKQIAIDLPMLIGDSPIVNEINSCTIRKQNLQIGTK